MFDSLMISDSFGNHNTSVALYTYDTLKKKKPHKHLLFRNWKKRKKQQLIRVFAQHLDCTGCAACFDSSLHVQFECRSFNHHFSFKYTHRYGHMNSLLSIMTLFISWMTGQADEIRLMGLNTWSFIFINNSKAQMSVFSSPRSRC